MASSLISSRHHIDLDSVFGIDDAGLVQMFESLIATGLKEFLGCPAVIYEAALTEFFANGSVRDGLVVSTIKGRAVEISEEVFAATFELPTEGLTDFSEVPKDLLFDARSLFSISKEQVSISCFKKDMKIEYRLLSDILAKTIYVKAGSFDAVTRERFMLMTAITFDVKVNWSRLLFDVLKEMVTPGSRHAKGYAIQISVLLKNIPGFELGESRAFPVPRVLNEQMVHRYVVINEKIGGAEIPDSPMLKKTPAKKAVSKKSPVFDVEVAPVVKKKRTTKGKPVVIAQEAVPLQIVEGTVDAPVEQLPVPKRKIQKRKRRLVLEAEDDLVVDEPVVGGSTAEHPAAEAATGVQEPVVEATTDDPDKIIEQVLDQLDSVATTDGEDQPAVTGAEERHWFDLPYEDLMARLDAERPVVTASDTDEDMAQVFTETDTAETTVGPDTDVGTVGTVVGNEQLQLVEEADEEMSGDSEQAVDERIDTDEAMSLEDILMTIPVDVPLPSASMEITKITMGKEIKIPGVDERTWYLTSLSQIPVDDKGKEILVEKDPVKGNPAKEHYSLICTDIDLLVHLRAQVIGAVDQFFHYFSFKKLATINVEEMAKKEEQVLYWGETETIRVALNRKMYILLKYREDLVINMLSDLHLFVLEDLKEQALAHGLTWKKKCCSKIFEGRPRDRGAVIARTNTNTPSRCCIRTMLFVDGVWTAEPCADYWVKIPRPVVQNEVHRQCSYVDTLPTVSEFFKILRKIWADICIEAVAFFVSGRLLPVGSINFCRSLSVDGPVYRVAPRHSTVFVLWVSQFCTIFIDYSLISRLPSEDIGSFVGSIALERTVLRSVQIPTLSADSQHDRVLGELRKDSNDQRSLTSLEIKSSHKQLSNQIVTIALDVVDVRRVVRENHQELIAKVTSLEEQVPATRHDLLEFSSQAQQTLNVITDQLSELVAYINRGGNDKKGEVVSSSRPPPDDQNRGSGNTGGGGDIVRTTDIPQRDIDTAQRNILERLMSADRARERERRSKRRSGSGSYKMRRLCVRIESLLIFCTNPMYNSSDNAI
ncbi:hypothetical protein F511_38830 [Dorcoceras hygrometricum]|uniref:Dystroglycan-like n=1 Tax=Dorcoceras hygrometricum TaxID=472368 RepID=A0A2Z7AB64_9LAMI|nr:hypothetical protein F511_38830 [Dorcoceras hygrometricum]